MDTILFEAHHPSHVLFAFALKDRFEQHGLNMHLILQSRPEAVKLAKELNLDFELYPQRRRGFFSTMLNLFQGWKAVIRAIKISKPKLVVSISGVYTSFPARICGVKNILFTDTETALFSHIIAYPFADKIFHPSSYRIELDKAAFLSAKKRKIYDGHQETAYMTSNAFLEIIRQFKPAEKKYAFIRAIAWGAYHEEANHSNWNNIIDSLFQLGIKNIIASCESAPPEELRPFVFQASSLEYHSYLRNASIVITEGATTATEATYYRAPVIFINKNLYGTIQDSKKNGLLLYANNFDEAKEILKNINLLELKEKLSSMNPPKKINPLELIYSELN